MFFGKLELFFGFCPHPHLQQNAFNPVTLVASSVFKPTVDITYSLSSIEMVSVDPENVR